MSCPSWQWHRTGSRWSPVRTLPVAPLWCDLGFVPNSRGNKAAANLRPLSLYFDVDDLLNEQKMRRRGRLWNFSTGSWRSIDSVLSLKFSSSGISEVDDLLNEDWEKKCAKRKYFNAQFFSTPIYVKCDKMNLSKVCCPKKLVYLVWPGLWLHISTWVIQISKNEKLVQILLDLTIHIPPFFWKIKWIYGLVVSNWLIYVNLWHRSKGQ